VPPPTPYVPARVRFATLGVLALAFFLTGLHQAARDAPTVDEGVDISSGVSHLVRHDLRMVPEHPPLPKVVAALPALLANPIVPDTPAWEEGAWFDWSDDFISANHDAGRLDAILLWSRAMVLLQTIGCAALLYLLTTRFFGPDGGLLVTAAWLTTPYVVGLGHFAMIDIPFVLVTLATSLLLARWVDHPSTGRTVALGVVLAAGLASRHTALVLCLVVVAVMAHRLRRSPREAAIAIGTTTLVAVVGLWLVYRGLAPGGSSAEVEARFTGLVSSQGDASLPVRVIGALPLPIEWQAGFAYLDLTSVPRPSSLLGQSWDGGRWWYFPVSAIVKLPTPLLVAVVAGWAVAAGRTQHRRALLAFVVAPALVLWAFLLAQPLNLGLRLAMPTVALALVGLGALAVPPASGTRGWAAHRLLVPPLLALVAVAQVTASVAAVPHSLAYTPPPWRPEHRWVSDANLDAGQALYELRAWAEERDEPYVAFDTTRGMSVQGGSRPLRDVAPAEVRGWVAVGVTPLMQTRRDELAWLRKYCAVGTLGGGSVVIYRFRAAPDPAPGPAQPARPCFGATESTVVRR
jgi:4-amino-4-deoxy-L-arabinose transferase-like glycosyltransferase